MRLLHTMIRVGNLEKSIDFYVNNLKMKLFRRKDYKEGRFTLAFLGYGEEEANTMIELTYNWDKEKYNIGNGFGHIAIAVKDIFDVCEALKANNCKIVREPGPMKNSSTILAFIEDPDGYKIELIEK